MTGPLPFPYPLLRVGVDICQISRIQRILTCSRRGPRFVRRILTEEERVAAAATRKLIFESVKEQSRPTSEDSYRGEDSNIQGKDTELWKQAVFMSGR
jgi:hypothetical protein